jgi:hypothetical protein
MKHQRTGFYKGIPGFTVSSDDGLLEAAEASIYKQWWSFMRLSPVYWYARKTGIAPVIPEIAASYEKAGNLALPNFNIWWNKHGKYVFEEVKRPAKVRLVDIDDLVEHELYQKSILVEIPLTVTAKKIVRDVKELLREIEHDVTGRNVIKLSDALLKLKSKKFNLTTIEHEHWVLIYRILHPDIAVWKIGDRLQLAPNNKVRNIDLRGLTASFSTRGRGPVANLQSLTGRNLYKARFARHHVERGSFPNYTRVTELDSTQPFGPRHHKEFLEATREVNRNELGERTPNSPWKQHVDEEYAYDLKHRILRANRHDRQYISDPKFKDKYSDFIAGLTDLN